MKRWLRRLAFTLLGFTVAVGLYVAVACVMVFWPANAKPSAKASAEAAAVEAWVLSNGLHTDLVFPIRSEAIDWRQLFPFAHSTCTRPPGPT